MRRFIVLLFSVLIAGKSNSQCVTWIGSASTSISGIVSDLEKVFEVRLIAKKEIDGEYIFATEKNSIAVKIELLHATKIVNEVEGMQAGHIQYITLYFPQENQQLVWTWFKNKVKDCNAETNDDYIFDNGVQLRVGEGKGNPYYYERGIRFNQIFIEKK